MRVKRKFESEGHLLTAIYLLVEDLELDEGTAYRITLLGTMPDEKFQSPAERQKAQALLNSVETYLGECGGIEVKESSLQSEGKITLEQIKHLKRWDYDYLSLRDESVTSLPPAG